MNEPVVERDRRTEEDARGNVLLVDDTPNVALGMSDAGTAEMGAGACPPYGGLHGTHHVSSQSRAWGTLTENGTYGQNVSL